MAAAPPWSSISLATIEEKKKGERIRTKGQQSRPDQDKSATRIRFDLTHSLLTIELRGAEHLNLADKDVLEGEDRLAGLLDLLADVLGDELLNELLEGDGGSLAGDDGDHLLAEGADLRGLGVAGLGGLVLLLLGEANDEDADGVAVVGADINVGLNQSLPLADKRAELIGGQVHAVEVGEAGVAPGYPQL